MSRLSRKPIEIPKGVTVLRKDDMLHVAGPRGEEVLRVLPMVEVALDSDTLKISSSHTTKQARANVGTMASLTKSAILGVTEGFTRILEIEGVGYRAALEGEVLVLSLGYVNPVKFTAPSGVTMKVEKNVITISGNNKGLVTQAAAKIRSFKKPEPYKGKGIRYRGEVVRRKVGKKAAAAKA